MHVLPRGGIFLKLYLAFLSVRTSLTQSNPSFSAMNIPFLYLAKIIAQLVGKTHGLIKVQAISVLLQWNLTEGLVWIHPGVVALTIL